MYTLKMNRRWELCTHQTLIVCLICVESGCSDVTLKKEKGGKVKQTLFVLWTFLSWNIQNRDYYCLTDVWNLEISHFGTSSVFPRMIDERKNSENYRWSYPYNRSNRLAAGRSPPYCHFHHFNNNFFSTETPVRIQYIIWMKHANSNGS